MRRLELRPATDEEVAAEIERNLLKGRAFVAGAAGLGERERCELAVVHPRGGELVLPAEAVWNAPNGVGLALALDAEARARVLAFAQGPAPEAPPQPGEEPEDDDQPEEARRVARNVHERVRAMSIRDREDLARRGGMPERVALERAFGANVWEPLLQNPQISAVEVAKIAKNGALSRPLVSAIVANGAWLAVPEVQRALLSNPRCSGRELDRVLSMIKPQELARLAQGGPYRQEVRQAAQRLVRR